jgi:hypothetical protein
VDDAPPPDPPPSTPTTDAEKLAALASLLRHPLNRAGAAAPPPLGAAPLEQIDDLDYVDRSQDIRLKGMYAVALLVGLASQVVIVDGLVYLYAWQGRDWNLPPSVVQVWIGATVVQIIGIVLVITRYLFPRR